MFQWIAEHPMETLILAGIADGILGATPQDLKIGPVPVGKYTGVLRRGLRLVLRVSKRRDGGKVT